MSRSLPSLRAKLLRLLLPLIVALSAIGGVMVYQGLYDTILHRFEVKLTTISGLVGSFIDPQDHSAIANAMTQVGFAGPETEKSAPYVREIAPMHQVRRKLDLTYLYTQILTSPTKVRYVLDATEGEEHTTVGHEDELPDNTMQGLRGVGAQGRIYNSPIEKQEAWGLLKTAAAPIWTSNSGIAGSVGADVNIGIIRSATENALLICGLIGGVSMLLAAASVSMVVNRVAQPLAAAKLSALAIAAGRFTLKPARPSLSELDAFAGELSELATQLDHGAQVGVEAGAALACQRRDCEVALALGELPAPAATFDLGAEILVAFAPPFSDDISARLWRAGVEAFAAACWDKGIPDGAMRLLESQGGGFLLVNPLARTATCIGQTLLLNHGEGAWSSVEAGTTQPIELGQPLRVRNGAQLELTIPPAGENKRVAA